MEELESNCIKFVGVKFFKFVNLLLSKFLVIVFKLINIFIKIMEGINEFVKGFLREEEN